MATDGVNEARALADGLAEELPRRWRHVQGVARQADQLSAGLEPAERASLIAAAWLHDIGYAPRLALTGFHPLDGARFLASAGFGPLLVRLVAYHSGAEIEADERHRLSQLAQIPEPPNELLRRLTAAAMTTSPDSDLVDPQSRIREILARYAPEHPVHRAASRSEDSLMATAQRIARRPP